MTLKDQEQNRKKLPAAAIPSDRQNNFNLLRLIGAVLVMAGHMGPILGAPEMILGGFALHTYGVEILFLIGGYMIANSWKRDPHPVRYLTRRFFRLYPAFAVMVLITVFAVGPLLSEHGAAGYFQSWWKAYLENLRFYIVYAQPGVFTTTPIANVTNGSLWTMPVEAALYIIAPLVLLIPGRKNNNKKWLWALSGLPLIPLIAAGTWADSLTVQGIQWVFYATDWASALKLAVFFLTGMFCATEKMRPFFKLQWAPIVLIIPLLVQYEPRWVQYTVMEITLPYLVFSLALAPKPIFAGFGKEYDLSYGIYLYGFLCQQMVTQWQRYNGYNLGMLGSLAVSMALTIPLAFLSCLLVERPMQKISRKLTNWRRT